MINIFKKQKDIYNPLAAEHFVNYYSGLYENKKPDLKQFIKIIKKYGCPDIKPHFIDNENTTNISDDKMYLIYDSYLQIDISRLFEPFNEYSPYYFEALTAIAILIAEDCKFTTVIKHIDQNIFNDIILEAINYGYYEKYGYDYKKVILIAAQNGLIHPLFAIGLTQSRKYILESRYPPIKHKIKDFIKNTKFYKKFISKEKPKKELKIKEWIEKNNIKIKTKNKN